MNNNLLILRLSNVFGYENGKKKKPYCEFNFK